MAITGTQNTTGLFEARRAEALRRRACRRNPGRRHARPAVVLAHLDLVRSSPPFGPLRSTTGRGSPDGREAERIAMTGRSRSRAVSRPTGDQVSTGTLPSSRMRRILPMCGPGPAIRRMVAIAECDVQEPALSHASRDRHCRSLDQSLRRSRSAVTHRRRMSETSVRVDPPSRSRAAPLVASPVLRARLRVGEMDTPVLCESPDRAATSSRPPRPVASISGIDPNRWLDQGHRS